MDQISPFQGLHEPPPHAISLEKYKELVELALELEECICEAIHGYKLILLTDLLISVLACQNALYICPSKFSCWSMLLFCGVFPVIEVPRTIKLFKRVRKCTQTTVRSLNEERMLLLRQVPGLDYLVPPFFLDESRKASRQLCTISKYSMSFSVVWASFKVMLVLVPFLAYMKHLTEVKEFAAACVMVSIFLQW